MSLGLPSAGSHYGAARPLSGRAADSRRRPTFDRGRTGGVASHGVVRTRRRAGTPPSCARRRRPGGQRTPSCPSWIKATGPPAAVPPRAHRRREPPVRPGRTSRSHQKLTVGLCRRHLRQVRHVVDPSQLSPDQRPERAQAVTSGEGGRVGLKHPDRRQRQASRGAHGEATEEGRCRQVDDVRLVRRKHRDQLAGCRIAHAVRPEARQRSAPPARWRRSQRAVAGLGRGPAPWHRARWCEGVRVSV
jgi:hypothetical protein